MFGLQVGQGGQEEVAFLLKFDEPVGAEGSPTHVSFSFSLSE